MKTIIILLILFNLSVFGQNWDQTIGGENDLVCSMLLSEGADSSYNLIYQYESLDTFSMPQTQLADFLDLYEEYEKICEIPSKTKETVEYEDFSWSGYEDKDIDTITVMTVGGQGITSSHEEYHNRKTKTAWKYVTKTYKPCFEGFILFLKNKLRKEGRYRKLQTIQDYLYQPKHFKIIAEPYDTHKN